jgi:hypothetical protein
MYKPFENSICPSSLLFLILASPFVFFSPTGSSSSKIPLFPFLSLPSTGTGRSGRLLAAAQAGEEARDGARGHWAMRAGLVQQRGGSCRVVPSDGTGERQWRGRCVARAGEQRAARLAAGVSACTRASEGALVACGCGGSTQEHRAAQVGMGAHGAGPALARR